MDYFQGSNIRRVLLGDEQNFKEEDVRKEGSDPSAHFAFPSSFSVVGNFNVKLKVCLYMHGVNNNFLVLQFSLTIPITRGKSCSMPV